MLKNLVPVSPDTLTARECKALADRAVVSDDRSSSISALHVIAMQFFVHMTMNSKDTGNGFVNTYAGKVMQGDGLYPDHPDHPLFDKAGRLNVGWEDGLPEMHIKDATGKRMVKWLSGDINRSTENQWLAAMHLHWHKFHNKMHDILGNSPQAKSLAVHYTLGTVARFFMNEFMAVTGMDEREIFDTRKSGAVNTLECIMGFGRWGHAQVPATIGGIGIFEKVGPQNIDLKSALDDKARVLNFGCCEPMSMMPHLPMVDGQNDIVDLNLNRHVTVKMADWGDIKKVYREGGYQSDLGINPNTPIWTAILMEAEATPGDTLGPTGARLIADIAADALEAPRGYGLWTEEWDGKPYTQREILEFVD